MAAMDKSQAADTVIYVRDGGGPVYFDPYYNRPKVFVPAPPPTYYETKSKNKHGNKVTTKTTIRNEYGDVVYKSKSTKKKKK